MKRLYFIDWLRVLAFFTLILFHSAMPFVDHPWEVKNGDHSTVLYTFITWFHQWRLPLLFFISGVGIHFSLQKRSVFRFFIERVQRLFIPLLFAMFFTIPLQVYVEYLQKGKVHTSYFKFYPEVWKFIPYPDGALSWSHMWFVVYLFTFIFLLIPLLLLFKTRVLSTFKTKFSAFFNNPIALLVPAFVIFVIYQQNFLKYPEQGSLVDDWFVFFSSVFYVQAGYFFAASERFWEGCEKYRVIYLVTALTATMVLLVRYYTPVRIPREEGPGTTFYFVLVTLLIWNTILSAIGYARKYLNKPSALLAYLNEAVFPFFIIHQTVIVGLGYLVVQLDLNLWIKFLMLSAGSAVLIFSFYHFIIRRTLITRFLYGMKLKRGASSAQAVVRNE